MALETWPGMAEMWPAIEPTHDSIPSMKPRMTSPPLLTSVEYVSPIQLTMFPGRLAKKLATSPMTLVMPLRRP